MATFSKVIIKTMVWILQSKPSKERTSKVYTPFIQENLWNCFKIKSKCLRHAITEIS